MQVVNHANLSSEEIAQIESELPEQQTLNDVMTWAFAQPPGTFVSTIVADVIVQDEFTHDVIVPYRDKLVFVYDTT